MSIILHTDADGAAVLPAELCRAAGIGPQAEMIAEVKSGRIVLGLAHQSLAARIAANAKSLPAETLEKMPADGAEQHDHYIYGTPKR